VVEVTKFLENSGIVNAGRGSNLNLDGKIECDASVMHSDQTFGAVAAVSGIRRFSFYWHPSVCGLT
jgi:taspase (threonine aspartase 1)